MNTNIFGKFTILFILIILVLSALVPAQELSKRFDLKSENNLLSKQITNMRSIDNFITGEKL